MSIQVSNITKTFAGFTALKDVSLHVATGEMVALLGPSGSGKTTLLRIIAGLEQPDGPATPASPAPAVHFADQDVTTQHTAHRRVGFVFQHYALFRHMTVLDNVAFGLRVRKRADRPTPAEITERVHKLLDMVQLTNMSHRYPGQLSGGQRQRVALARALAVEPSVLLLDEPFGALDAKVRKELRRWLRKLQDTTGITSVFVTHDQEEALEVADRIAVMSQGRIEQIGTPEEVYDRPANRFVMEFLGSVNLFHRRTEHASTDHPGTDQSLPESAPRTALIRPHDISITRHPTGDHAPVRVTHISAAGPVVRIQLTRTDTGDDLEAELSRDEYRSTPLKVGDTAYAGPRHAALADYTI
jgi:sulfate transport system ATP-binding protein